MNTIPLDQNQTISSISSAINKYVYEIVNVYQMITYKTELNGIRQLTKDPETLNVISNKIVKDYDQCISVINKTGPTFNFISKKDKDYATGRLQSFINETSSMIVTNELSKKSNKPDWYDKCKDLLFSFKEAQLMILKRIKTL
jgi:hypothetical protein